MTELLTSAQMRAIEAAAIASGEVTGLDLMERAGAGVVAAVLEEWPEMALTAHRAVVLCGPGGNGGDGFVVARLLKARGWEVEVFLYGDPARMPPDAKVNYERWVGTGEVGNSLDLLTRHGWDSETNLCFGGEEVVFIDALFGSGLSRAIDHDLLAFTYEAFERNLGKSVSLDCVSGCCIDSGRQLLEEASDEPVWRPAVHLIVTFHRAKVGHFLLNDQESMGQRLRIVDIGLNKTHWLQMSKWRTRDVLAMHRGEAVPPAPVWWVGAKGPVDSTLPIGGGQLGKRFSSHKYSHGHALILSGPPATAGPRACRPGARSGSGRGW